VIGAYLAQFIPAPQLQKSFGYFLLVVATFVLVQNRDSLQGLKKSSTQQQPQNALSDGREISAGMLR